MMRIQYDSIIKTLYETLDEILDLETKEGNEVFVEMIRTIQRFHPDQKHADMQLQFLKSIHNPKAKDVKGFVGKTLKGMSE